MPLTGLGVTAIVAALAVAAATTTYMVPMRDGVQLHTDVDFPLSTATNYTVVIDRSPYGADKLELIADIFLLWGYAAVRQDMRGCQQSQGNFTLWHADANDSYDTMQWIAQQTWSNGRVYSVGASADGLGSFTMIENSPKWLKAQFIVFASSVGWDIVFPGGAFRQALTDFWMNITLPAQASELVQEIKANEAHGPWWNALNSTGQYHKVDFPSVLWAGWYDIFLVGNLIGFDGYQNQAAVGSRGQSHLVVDPLGHCQKAYKMFPQNLLFGRVLLPITLAVDMYQGKNIADRNISAVTFYVMGPPNATATGNFWTSLPAWPTFQPTSYYLHTDGSLSTSAPSASTGSKTIIYNPADPVPTIGGNNLEIPCGPLAQNSVESRADVLVFTTPVLESNVAVTGPLTVTLYVSTNCTDTDFTAKLTDVYPSGQSLLIQDGIIRMRWRNLGTEPDLLKPGNVYEVQISLWNTSYIFNAGHSIRVSLSSSNYPRFSPNPNNGLPLTKSGPLLIAENNVHISSQYPSRLVLPVVTMEQLPVLDLNPLEAPEGISEADALAALEHIVATIDALSD